MPGWEQILGPLLDKLIIDVLGGKQNGRWHNGALDDKRLGDVKVTNLAWYKRALTDFHSYIYAYVDPLDSYRAEYKQISEDLEAPKEEPMESDYAADEKGSEDTTGDAAEVR